MKTLNPGNLFVTTRHLLLALDAIESAGLQVPPDHRLRLILECASSATSLHWVAALRQPTWSELDEAFKDFVIRAINTAPGVGDAAAN